jgi:hypothetical protein
MHRGVVKRGAALRLPCPYENRGPPSLSSPSAPGRERRVGVERETKASNFSFPSPAWGEGAGVRASAKLPSPCLHQAARMNRAGTAYCAPTKTGRRSRPRSMTGLLFLLPPLPPGRGGLGWKGKPNPSDLLCPSPASGEGAGGEGKRKAPLALPAPSRQDKSGGHGILCPHENQEALTPARYDGPSLSSPSAPGRERRVGVERET